MLNSDKLWRCVLSHVSANKNNQEQNLAWHIADEEKVECIQCSEPGGPVVKCVVDRCKREYHMGCAFERGGFYLEDDESNTLTFYCEFHHKPPLFCICQKPYDLSAEMVCCDECVEWFHIECIGVSKREVARLENYVCSSCSKIKSEGKQTPPQERERNLTKEKRSQLQQDANKRFRLLVEVCDMIAPLIDQLEGLAKTDFSLSVISEAFKYLSSDQYECVPADDPDATDRLLTKSGTAPELIPDSLFGAESLIRDWRLRLRQASADFIDWKISVKALLARSTQDLATCTLLPSQLTALESYLAGLEELRTDMVNLNLPADVATYASFLDTYTETWTHVHHFLQTLHTEKQSGQWQRQLDNHWKAAVSRSKRLQSQANDLPSVLVQMLTNLMDNIRAARNLLDNMAGWSEAVIDVLNAAELESIEEVQALYDSSKNFPLRLDLADKLAAQLEAAQKAEKAVKAFLQKSDLDYEEHDQLAAQVNELQVKIPSADAFDAAGLSVGFLQNYDALMASSRVPLDAVEQLEVLCQDILRGDEQTNGNKSKSEKPPPLVAGLSKRLVTCKTNLQKLMKESELYVSDSTKAIEAFSADASFDFSQILSRLQSSRVITVNESIITFLQAFESLHAKIKGRLDSDLSGVPISEIEALRNELQQYVDSAPATSVHMTYMEKRRIALALLDTLSDLVQRATRAWQELDRLIDLCKEGALVSHDEYKSCVDKVTAAKLDNAEIRIKYEALETAVAEFSARCARVLPTITDPTAHFATLSELADTIKELPVTKQLSEQILLRHDVCSLARKCILVSQQPKPGDSMDVDSDATATPYSDIFDLRKVYRELQDLLHHVLKSAPHVSHPIEEAILTSVKPGFQLFFWRQEIAHLQVSSIDKVIADELAFLAAEIEAAVKTPMEWSVLESALQSLQTLETEAASVFQALERAQEASNEAVRNSSTYKQRASLRSAASSDSHSNEFDITSFALGGKAWKSAIGDAQSVLQSLIARYGQLRVTKKDLQRSIDDALQITNKILSVQLQIMNIHISLVKNSEEDSNKDPAQLLESPSLEFRDLTTLVNDFNAIADKQPNFLVVDMISKFLLSFHTRATRWNDKALSVIPAKSTRRKKGEPKSVTLKEIEDLYKDPLCRAVKVPALTGVLTLLNEARIIQAETVTMLNDRNAAASPKPSPRSGGPASPARSTTDATDDSAGEDEDYYSRKSLLDQINAVNEKLVRIEMLPFDMVESSILSWFLEILTWVYNLPNLYLDYLYELHSTTDGKRHPPKEAVGVMSLVDARLQITQCNDMVNDRTSPDVVSWLLEKKILTEDAATGAHYYSDNVSPYLDRSQEIADQLKQWVDLAEELESRVRTGVSGGESLESLQSLLREVNGSALLIDPVLKRNLESQIQRQLKRGRDESDSLLKSKATAPEEKKKKSKASTVKCAYTSCSASVEPDSAYCSSQCALQHAPRLCKDMLAYREVLCSTMSLPKAIAALPQVAALVEEDRQQFQVSPVNPVELFSDVTREMTKRGYVAASKSTEREKEKEKLTLKNAKDLMTGTPTKGTEGTKDDSVVERKESDSTNGDSSTLEDLLTKAEKFLSRSLLESGRSTANEALHRDLSKLSAAQIMLASLPPRVSSVMSRRGGDAAAGGANTPASPKYPASIASADLEMRKQVRFLFEDIFVASLSRQAISGALCLGSILALELEQELFNKAYVVTQPAAAGSKAEPRKELNKKEYKDNQIRLFRNLKQSHNDGLIARLARQEMSIDALLLMTPQQLADASLQTERAKIISSAIRDSHIKESVQDTLSAHMREAMAGNESWRSKDVSDVSSFSANSDRHAETSTSTPATNKVESGKVKLDIAKMKQLQQQQQQEKQHGDGTKEDDATEASEHSQDDKRKPKRPLNVDAGTRMTTDRPKKRKENPENATEDKKGLSSSSTDSQSPRESSKTKAPNVLDMLKAGVQPGQERKLSLSTPQFRLVSASGKMELNVNTTTASSSPHFACVGCAADRRILGQLKDPLVVTGRTRIAELETFILQVQEKGRKMVIPFVLFTHKGLGAASTYAKFCEEFAHNSRAGFCQMATDLQAYLVPPALKHHLTLLKEYTVPGGSSGFGREIYGVLIAREPGPVEFTSASTVELDVMAPPEPLAPPPPVVESKQTEKPKAAAVAAPPAPVPPTIAVNPTLVPAYKGPAPSYAPAPSLSSVPPPPPPPTFVPPPTFTAPRPAAAAPAPAPAPAQVVSIPTPAPVALLAPEMRAMIRKVAEFCAANGAQTIQMLRNKENAVSLMPFIFPGQTGHQEFLNTLKEILQASNTIKA